MQHGTIQELRLIDRWKVIDMLGIPETALERLMVREGVFPMRRRISSRTLHWLEHEVQVYISKLEVLDFLLMWDDLGNKLG